MQRLVWFVGLTAVVLAKALPPFRPFHQTVLGGAVADGGQHHDALPGGIKPYTRWIPAVRLSRTGFAGLMQVSRQAMAQELRCPLRDLRLVDPSFPGVYPAVVSRKSAIILSILQVKAIIKNDEVFIFNPDSLDSQELVHALQQQLNATASVAPPAPHGSHGLEGSHAYQPNVAAALQQPPAPVAAAVNSATTAAAPSPSPPPAGSSASASIFGPAPPPMPFEQVVMEACLTHICQRLFARVQKISARLKHVLVDLREGASLKARLDQLLPIKNELNEMQYALQEVCKCINDVLTNDEDMARMYLTEAHHGNRRSREHHEEIEMMFENYLLQAEVLASDIKEYQNEIRNTEEIVEIELDVMRNRILKYELVLSLSSFAVGGGALVTGMFGMNLLSHLEQNPNMFWIVSAAIFGVILASLGTTLGYLRAAQVL